MPSVKDILSGDPRAGARMIRMVEDRDPGAFDLLKQLFPHCGKAFIMGITGSPGAGKSTLINALITEFRGLDMKIAVIAVDPSSPVSGGAVLGDRLRMQHHADDENVFIRSMASRGQKGGLSRATKDAAMILDAMGHHIIIIETVGAGQGDFDIAGLVHSVGIVTIPGTGDGIQAVKAGILETGDIFIVNKCDMPGADAAALELELMLKMRKPLQGQWMPGVFKTCALKAMGTGDLARAFLSHFDFMKSKDLLEQKRKKMEQVYFQSLLTDLIQEKIGLAMTDSQAFKDVLKKIAAGKMDPITGAQGLVSRIAGFFELKDRT